MRFDHLVKEIISESLDNPYPFKYSEQKDSWIFFPNPENQNVFYSVSVLNDEEYGEEMRRSGRNFEKLKILFTFTNKSKNIDGTTDMLNFNREELNALNIVPRRVISTVAAIVEKHLRSYGLDKYAIIEFDGKNSDESRISLYDTLAVKLLNFLGKDKWEYDKFKHGTQTTFEFSRFFA